MPETENLWFDTPSTFSSVLSGLQFYGSANIEMIEPLIFAPEEPPAEPEQQVTPERTSDHTGKWAFRLYDYDTRTGNIGEPLAEIWVNPNYIARTLKRRVVGSRVKVAVTHESHIIWLRCLACKKWHKWTSGYELFCPRCRPNYAQCHLCETVRPRQEFYYDRQRTAVCNSDDAPCRETYKIALCVRCSGILWYRRGHNGSREARYCTSCLEQLSRSSWQEATAQPSSGRSALQEYSYRPSPIFLPSLQPDTLYLGVELETDKYPRMSGAVTALAQLEEHNAKFYMKRDGSLHNGIEIVTHPAILAYHKETFGWENIISKVKECGGKSHYTDTCGLHVHFNADFLGARSTSERDRQVLKLLYMVTEFWEQLLKFSRRMPRDVHWTKPYKQRFRKMTLRQYHTVKGNAERHMIINLHPPCDTLEIRIFRGTLRLETFYASLELVDFLVKYIKRTTAPHIYRTPWAKLVQLINPYKYPNLDKYLKRKRLKPKGEEECALLSPSRED